MTLLHVSNFLLTFRWLYTHTPCIPPASHTPPMPKWASCNMLFMCLWVLLPLSTPLHHHSSVPLFHTKYFVLGCIPIGHYVIRYHIHGTVEHATTLMQKESDHRRKIIIKTTTHHVLPYCFRNRGLKCIENALYESRAIRRPLHRGAQYLYRYEEHIKIARYMAVNE